MVVRRRPARRWKALESYFRLSIGFPGVWRGPDGLRGASVHVPYIGTAVDLSFKNNAIYYDKIRTIIF